MSADPDLQRTARSARTALQPPRPRIQTKSCDNGKTATSKRAKPSVKWRKPLRITYWNVNGMGSEWDGTHSSKLAALQRAGPFDAILLVETHLTCLPTGPEWIVSDPVDSRDPAAGALIWLGPRLRHSVIAKGKVGSRLVWARVRTDTHSDLLLVSHYIAHYQRTHPSREDCYDVAHAFLNTQLKSSDRVVYCVDTNSKIRRNIPGVTGKYSM